MKINNSKILFIILIITMLIPLMNGAIIASNEQQNVPEVSEFGVGEKIGVIGMLIGFCLLFAPGATKAIGASMMASGFLIFCFPMLLVAVFILGGGYLASKGFST